MPGLLIKMRDEKSTFTPKVHFGQQHFITKLTILLKVLLFTELIIRSAALITYKAF